MARKCSKSANDSFETYYEGDCEYQSVDQCKVCKKSKYHQYYINASTFTKQDLPPKFQTDIIFKLVQLLALLTVKIKVNYVSEGRIKPKNFSYMTSDFPFADRGGQNLNFNGSGRIWDIFPRNEKPEFNDVTCPCPNCKGKENKKIWIAKVYTATHVVFDNKEAQQAECILFYDNSTESQKQKLYGLEAKWSHDEGDLCILYCATCDESLVEKIRSMNLELRDPWKELEKDGGYNKKEKIAVIVSHPHGCPKVISVGKWISRDPVNKEVEDEHRFTYKRKVSTCSGSSGGPVYILGSSYLKSAYCHSGSNEKVNFSSCWRDKDDGSCDRM